MSFNDIQIALDITRQETAAQIAEIQSQLDGVRAEYAEHLKTHIPVPPPPPPPSVDTAIIGMSSPRAVWDERVQQVGPGLGARRIFGDLTDSGTSQADIIREAIRDGLIPVISYKGVPSASNLAAVGSFLRSLNTTLTATYWHEPYGDMTGAVYVARATQFVDAIQSDNIHVGPFLNGWLLDRQVATFKSFTSPYLLNKWKFMGIDTYEEGTIENPGEIKPADRIPKLHQFMKDNGIPNKPVVIGEYNGYSYETIKEAGDAILDLPNTWIGCMWNSTIGKGHTLTGDRLTAFKETLADPRVVN